MSCLGGLLLLGRPRFLAYAAGIADARGRHGANGRKNLSQGSKSGNPNPGRAEPGCGDRDDRAARRLLDPPATGSRRLGSDLCRSVARPAAGFRAWGRSASPGPAAPLMYVLDTNICSYLMKRAHPDATLVTHYSESSLACPGFAWRIGQRAPDDSPAGSTGYSISSTAPRTSLISWK